MNKKCTENQTRNLIREAATNTEVRKSKIMDLLRTIRHNNAPIIQGFGLKIATDFAKVPARKLDAPEIQYKNDSVKVTKGVWKVDNQQFLIPEKASNWAIINFSSRIQRNQVDDLAKQVYNLICYLIISNLFEKFKHNLYLLSISWLNCQDHCNYRYMINR